MNTALSVGTLLRLPDITAERLNFLHNAGIESCQLARVGEDWLSTGSGEKKSDELFALLQKNQILPASVFLYFIGHPADIPTNGYGFIPENRRVERMVFACRQMNWAKSRGIKYISCHVGTMPKEKTPFYEQLISDLRMLVTFAEENGQFFLFETGPESVLYLKNIFADIDKKNLGINFDPANLLIYGNDDPSVMLDEMFDRIKVVHCKDAVRSKVKGEMGKETVLGQGATNFESLLARLCRGGYRGPLIIERELMPGPEQEKDVAEAVIYINKLKNKFLKGA